MKTQLTAPLAARARSAGAALAASVLAACQASTSSQPPAPPPPEVTVVEVAARPVALTYEFPGRLEGSREVEVRARVQGTLLLRSYEEGRPVTKGQTLFVIDPAPYKAEVQAAEAQIAEERAKLLKAERDRARLEPLLAERAASQRDLDTAISDVEQFRALVMSGEARLTKAKLDLSYTRVAAPIAGLSGRAFKSEGSLVGPGNDSLLTRISQVQPIWVRFAISDEDLLGLRHAIEQGIVDAPAKDRFEVELSFADGKVHPERGLVNFSDSLIDPQTGSIDLRAEFANAAGELVPGQFVRVKLLGIVRAAAILVPQRAVQQGQTGKYVLVAARDGKAESRPVEVGPWIGDGWLIESGLSPGERVIVGGVARVQPGATVKVTDGAAPAGQTPAPPAPRRVGKP